MNQHVRRWLSIGALLLAGAVLVAAFAIRLPVLYRDMWEAFAWKSIRYHQLAIDMMKTGDPFFGATNYSVRGFSESLLASWYLIAAYRLLGVSVFNLHLAYVCLNLFSILVFFLAMRRFIGDGLALLGAFLLAVNPLVANYSGHAFGESFTYLGQILLVVCACALLQKQFRLRDAAGFVAVCALLCLSKISTGALLAVLGFFMVNFGLWLRHGEAVRAFARRRPALFWTLLIPYLGIPALGLAAFIVYTYSHWGQAFTELSQGQYYADVYRRAVDQAGYPLLVLMAAGVAGYLLVAVWRPLRIVARGVGELVGLGERPLSPAAAPFTVFESAVLGLFAANLIQTALQAWAFRVHDYYAISWVVPALLVGLCFAHRLWARGHRVLFLFLGTIWLVILACNLPVQAASLRAMYERQYCSQTDREMLRQFFSRRKLASPRYTVIARDPTWAYFAGVNMEFAWTWDELRDNFLRKDQRFIWDRNIDYVIYPRVCMPLDVRASLNTDPIVDMGPDCYQLGLVCRGTDCYIFKIVRGIGRIAPLPGGQFADSALPGWTAVGDPFHLDKVGRYHAAASTVEGRGNLLSVSFQNSGDALLYRAGGGLGWDINPGLPRAPGARVELIRNGETAYRQYPVTTDTLQLFAMDLDPSTSTQCHLNVIDSQADSSIRVGNFELISYVGYRDSAPCLIRRSAKSLLANASYATVQWPGQPDWAYIALDCETLVMSAHVVGDPGATELRVPAEKGTYELSGAVRLDGASLYPLILTVALRHTVGTETQVFEKQFHPGERSDLDLNFVIQTAGDELSIRCALPAGAENNYNAKFYFEDLQLTTVTAAEPPPPQ